MMRKWGVLLVAMGLGAACGNRRSEAKPEGASSGAPAADMQAPREVDLSKLDEGERKIFFRVANKAASVCGKPHSLMQSAKQDPSCRRSIFALRYAARLADDGFLESEIIERLDKRYLQKPVEVDVSGAPAKGDPKAPITVVEFADFECPHCKLLQPVLDRLLDEYKGQVKVYFKHFPLKNHSFAESAAYAAAAAQKQGKFWAMTSKIWKHQDALSPAEIEKYAKDAGLDVKKWKQDLESEGVKERVSKDRKDGDSLKILGTPVVYVNGREWSDVSKDYDTLKEWVDEELAIAR